MTWAEFWVVLACCALTMLACRALPLFRRLAEEYGR